MEKEFKTKKTFCDFCSEESLFKFKCLVCSKDICEEHKSKELTWPLVCVNCGKNKILQELTSKYHKDYEKRNLEFLKNFKELGKKTWTEN